MPKSTKGSVATATSIKTQVLPPVVPEFIGNDPKEIVFPEWVDQEINSEKWELPKPKASKSPKTPKTPKTAESQKLSKSSKSSEPPGSPKSEKLDGIKENLYVDPHNVFLPSYFLPREWKRPSEIYPDVTFVIRKDIWEYSDLISGNTHLFHSEFMRSFISSVGILEYLGFMNPWTMEGLGAGYVPNTDDKPWRGWHHIYSLCKAGKGQHHNPQVNNMGKYAVRLYWMGSWRKVMVDDLLPVDSTNHILLPTIHTIMNFPQQDNKALKDTQIELWPFLLCKALLKIASLTWNDTEDLVDCDIISMLTGWLVQKVNLKDSSFRDIWDMCAAYSDHFQWRTAKTDTDATTTKSKKHKEKASEKSESASSGKSKKNKDAKLGDADTALPYCLVASFHDMRYIQEMVLPDFAPCWSHNFLIDQSRDIPLVKPPPQPELARWKRFRWLAWAIRMGIYVDENFDLIKCLKVVSTFRKCAQHVVYHTPSNLSMDIKQSVNIIDEVIQGTSPRNTNGRESPEKSKELRGKSTDREMKSKNGKDKKGAKSPIIKPDDPSLWGDFNMMHSYFSHLYIYMKPSLFASNITISDFKDKSKPQKTAEKKSKDPSVEATLRRRFIWPNMPGPCRNEPFHLFMDSLDYKFIMITLSQAGNKNILLGDSYLDTTKPISNIVVEKYDWTSNQIGELSVSLNSLGSKSVVVQIKPGRNFLRLWIHSDSSFVIHVLSDVYLSAGTQESVFEYMQNESRMLLQMCFDIGSHFGKLIQAFGEEDFNEKSIAFHASYKPEKHITKFESRLIQREFSNELYELILEKYSTGGVEIIRALRILMIEFCSDYSRTPLIWKLKSEIIFDEEVSEEEEEEESIDEDFVEEKRRESAATKIQALFKMIYVRKLLAYRREEHPKYLKIFETLKKIYKELFSVENRIVTVSRLLRKMLLCNKNLIDFREYYQLYRDLQSVVNFQVVTGLIPVQIDTWIPIGRYVFYVNSVEPIKIKLCILCDIEVYYLRVFNNDTGQEIKRFSVNAAVEEYDSNINGYTVLIYGCSDQNGIMHTKFFLISLKKDTKSLIILPETQVHQSYTCDAYNPNVNNLIGRCQVFIKQDTAASFKFSCSLENVKVRLRCVDEMGHECIKMTGTGSLVLPVADLKYEAKKETDSQVNIIRSNSRQRSLRSKSTTTRNSTTKKKKRSLESGSVKSLDQSIGGSKRSVFGKDKSTESTFYLVEMYVLEDSWPLTMSEWKQVDVVRKRNLVGPKLFPDLFPTESEKMELSRKGEGDKKSASINIVLHKPAWCIQTISNKSDDVRVIVDTRRQEEINRIKAGWFENNPNRYTDAVALRYAFLESQHIQFEEEKSRFESGPPSYHSALYNTEEDTPEDTTEIYEVSEPMRESGFDENVDQTIYLEPAEFRAIKKPIPESERIAPLDYKPYAIFDKTLVSTDTIDDFSVDAILTMAKLKTEEDVAREERESEESLVGYDDTMDDYRESMLNLREKCLQQNLLIESWYGEIRDESADMMKSVYDTKQAYISELLERGKEKKSKKSDKKENN